MHVADRPAVGIRGKRIHFWVASAVFQKILESKLSLPSKDPVFERSTFWLGLGHWQQQHRQTGCKTLKMCTTSGGVNVRPAAFSFPPYPSLSPSHKPAGKDKRQIIPSLILLGISYFSESKTFFFLPRIYTNKRSAPFPEKKISDEKTEEKSSYSTN